MNSPIKNRIGMVFVPVSDMARAIAWYSQLLGVPVQTTSHEGTIYNVPMSGDVGLILDSTKKEVRNSSQPLFFLWTAEIQRTKAFLLESGVELVGDIQDIGSISILTFKDPDGNLLMVCQKH